MIENSSTKTGFNKLVLLGGGGFIGSRFLARFRENFSSIWLVDRFTGPSHPTFGQFFAQEDARRSGKDHVFCADVTEAIANPSILENADAVLILNADTGTAQSFFSPADCVRENASKLAKVVERINRLCDPATCRVVFTSSRAVYGEGNWACETHGGVTLDRRGEMLMAGRFEPLCPECQQPAKLLGTPEAFAFNPLSVYGLTKQFGEQLLSTVLGPTGFDIRIVRYQNVYGPGQEISNPYTGVLNWFSTALIKGETVEIYEQGRIIRDFIHVEDAARLLWALTALNRQKTAWPLVVNGGTGDSRTLLEIAELLRKRYGGASDIRTCDKYRVGDVLGALADVRRAAEQLNFNCRISLPDGLADYADWFRIQIRR